MSCCSVKYEMNKEQDVPWFNEAIKMFNHLMEKNPNIIHLNHTPLNLWSNYHYLLLNLGPDP